MKSAEIKNGKVTMVVNGISPTHYLPIEKKWVLPLDYPVEFYVTETKEPVVKVKDGKPFEEWNFILKNPDQIKDHIYDLIKEKRKEKVLSPFDVDGELISLKDKDSARDIEGLSINAKVYKVKKGIVLKGKEKIQILKVSAKVHVEGCYQWESDQIDLVEAITDIDELKVYVTNL